MALIAEEVVQEWLNRQGFFTIRGVRVGQGELDLLAVRYAPGGHVEGWHVEVQVSIGPIGYIASHRNNSAAARSEVMMREEATDWVAKKFNAERKRALRNQLFPSVDAWDLRLVYGEVKDEAELRMIGETGVRLHGFREILREISEGSGLGFPKAAGKDLVDLIVKFGVDASSISQRGKS
jgi:Holliday junction resolvase-like predicted endonuclease